jgi:hypothetical protein
MAFFENITREGFNVIMRRQERERLERFHGEERKRFILRCASGGGMRHVKSRAKRKKITLPSLSFMEDR